jgi:hypothetical protein
MAAIEELFQDEDFLRSLIVTAALALVAAGSFVYTRWPRRRRAIAVTLLIAGITGVFAAGLFERQLPAGLGSLLFFLGIPLAALGLIVLVLETQKK